MYDHLLDASIQNSLLQKDPNSFSLAASYQKLQQNRDVFFKIIIIKQ